MEWYDKLAKKVFSFFSQKEVKTPLSFFFRVVAAVVILTGIALGLAEPARRFDIFLVAIVMLLILSLAICIFAWLKPKNLVYGEAGHRAELKFALGTEKHEIAASEIGTLPATTNTALLTSGQQPLPISPEQS